jgi:hypothetical protein
MENIENIENIEDKKLDKKEKYKLYYTTYNKTEKHKKLVKEILSQKTMCNICNKSVTKGSLINHNKSKKHLQMLNKDLITDKHKPFIKIQCSKCMNLVNKNYIQKHQTSEKCNYIYNLINNKIQTQ